MVTPWEIQSLKVKADSGDAESAFLIYISHTDPASGAPQNWDLACEYLNVAYEGGHPDATLLLGVQYITGERIAKDLNKGKQLMQKAKDMGCANADDIAKMVGVNLSSDISGENEGQLDIHSLVFSCMDKSNELLKQGKIAPMQKATLMMVVNDYYKNNDLMGIMNIYGIMQNPQELEKLLNNSGNIIGQNSEDAIFFVKKNTKLKPFFIFVILFLIITLGIIGLTYTEVLSVNILPELSEIGIFILAFILINMIVISFVKLWNNLSINDKYGIPKTKFNYEKILDTERKRETRQKRKILSLEDDKDFSKELNSQNPTNALSKLKRSGYGKKDSLM